jgi:hypothetical protein
MTQMASFTKLERQVLSKQLDQAGFVEDVKKFFIQNIQAFLTLATEGKLSADYNDIALLPDVSPYYSFSSDITGNAAFKALEGSDVLAVMQRLAEPTKHRYQHVLKNKVKTNLKIKYI